MQDQENSKLQYGCERDFRSLLLSEERMSVDSVLAGRKTSFSVGIWLLVGSPYTCV